jgi:hypothetical protein
MEKMTKANFWDGLKTEYPDQTTDFLMWLDEWKRRERWNELFGEGHLYAKGVGEQLIVRNVKFHDLPNAMQIGIFIQYTVETGAHPFHCQDELIMDAWQMAIGQWFSREKENCGK